MASKRSKQKKKKTSPVDRAGASGDAEFFPESPSLQNKKPSILADWFSWAAFLAVLLACIGWVAVHAYLVDTVTVRLCDKADKFLAPEKRMPVFLSEIAFDGYVWNSYAEHLGENGEWRMRYTDFDNAPKGRDQTNWNSAFAWYLRGMGEIYRAVTGDSLRNSIFRMSIWANPILLALAIGIFATLSARRFGPLCGAVIAIGMVSVQTFYEGFMPAYPDHHGLIAFALLGMLFGIAWAGGGWVQGEGGSDFAPPHSLKQARHGMIFSAVCGAAGLWISAFSTVVVVIGIGAGTIVSVAVFANKMSRKDGVAFHPELWKFWGMVTAGGCLFFYLLENFPNHLGMRLEVNHPFYALAWLGGGWAIADITGWLYRPGRAIRIFPWRNVALCTLACSILPGFILLGGQRFYTQLDPFMIFMAANIVEGLPLATRFKMGDLTWQTAFGWFPTFLLAAGVLLASRHVGRGTKAVLIVLSFPIFLITAMELYQVRWGMLAGPLYIALAGIVVPQAWRFIPRNALSRGLTALVLLSLGYLFVAPTFKNTFGIPWSQFRSGDNISITFGQGLALLHRQMARAILDNAEGKPVVLLSSPNSSCLLAAIGGFKTIGTLYWENVEGLKAAASTLNAQSDDEALALIKKRGITHVSLMTWENFIEPFFRTIYPTPTPGKSIENSFGKRALYDGVIPSWSRPLIFPPNDLTKALHQQILMLQVVPDQSLAEAKFHLARFVRAVQGNPVQAEMTFKEILDASPESNRVRVELANLYIEQHRYEEAVDQTLKALPAGNSGLCESLAAQLAGDLVKAGQWSPLAKLLHAVASRPDATPVTLQNVAWIFATMPDATARDPKVALDCCDRLEKLPHDRGSLLLARAAALAASGDFKQAAILAGEAASSDSTNTELKAKAAAMIKAFGAGNVWTDGR